MATPIEDQEPWFLKLGAPVLFPAHDGLDLSMSQPAFDALVRDIVQSRHATQQDHMKEAKNEESDYDDSLTLVSTAAAQEIHGTSTQGDAASMGETRSESSSTVDPNKLDEPAPRTHPFIEGLLSHENRGSTPEGNMENRMLTENADVAYRSTTSPILDLFTELEGVLSPPRFHDLLNAAWQEDPVSTLKIVFNARSIHLGKSSRAAFYRCAGWLAQNHPLTLIANLRWLSRPIIQKKVEKKEEEDADIVVVEEKPEKDADDMTRFDVRHGVSHGYWKDLLNILVLSVNGQLHVLGDQSSILTVPKQKKPNSSIDGAKSVDPEKAKAQRHNTRKERHNRAVEAFHSDPVFQGLYLTVARLFAEQLKTDLALLQSDDPKAKQNISLCAKWAPSHDRFHDRHTFIVSSIAEMLQPITGAPAINECADRELFLRYARDEYRKIITKLRTHLDVVERKLCAKEYNKIHYDRVPSLAMQRYIKTFAEKDTERFENYLTDVAEGKMRISGAVLSPSTVIKSVREASTRRAGRHTPPMTVVGKVADGQWKTLVQRIKDSGTLESSIAVCDVSGSMGSPVFSDGTCPMDSAIGLSLLVAEITAPPFGGHFITFSASPKVHSVDTSASLTDKYNQLKTADWGMNTDFVAVFERLILPMAIKNGLEQADMVKRVFVFSDMQFDAAERNCDKFSSSFERIKRKYADAGYELPELIFWNLAGGRAGYGQGTYGDPTAPKPVTSEETGTAIVSGYSQAMLKVFLDGGSFDDVDGDDEESRVEITDDDDAVLVDVDQRTGKKKLDPLSTVRKAIGHEAYDALTVMD